MAKSEFAERLESLLKAQSKTLADLQRETGLKYHEMHSWLRRPRAQPRAASVERVALALGVSTTFLTTGHRGPNQNDPVLTELNQIISILSSAEIEVLLSAARTMRKQRLLRD